MDTAGRGMSVLSRGGALQASSDSAEQAQQQVDSRHARHAQHGFAQQVGHLPTVTTSESAAAEMLVGPPTAFTSNLYCPGTWGSWLQLVKEKFELLQASAQPNKRSGSHACCTCAGAISGTQACFSSIQAHHC